jgi:hypothetical protein
LPLAFGHHFDLAVNHLERRLVVMADDFCIWLNEKLGRPRLAFVDLIDW